MHKPGTALWILAALAWLGSSLLVWLGPVPLLQTAERAAYDSHLRSLPRRVPDPRIVVVGLDEPTLTRLKGLERPFYPLPRRFHARVTDSLRRAGVTS